MSSKEREDSFGNISSNINRWAAVAVLHPLGKRRPHVRSVLSLGLFSLLAVGSAAGSVGFKQEATVEIHLCCCCFCYFVEMKLLFWQDHLCDGGPYFIYLCDGGPDFQLCLGHFGALWQCNGSLESSQITFVPPLKHFCSDRMVLDDCRVHGHQICNGLIN